LEVFMRSHSLFPVLGALLVSLAAGPASADGHWTVSLGVGESVSELHGSAIDAAAYAQVHPLLGLGLEAGMAYMQLQSAPILIPAGARDGLSNGIASLTDGITRNRGVFVGPALRLGQQLYAVASAGIYEFSNNDGNWLATRWGGSAGLGLTGRGRFSPRAEVRYRWAPDPHPTQVVSFASERLPYPATLDRDASAIVFTIGANFH